MTKGRQSWDVAVSVIGVIIIVYIWGSSHIYIFLPWVEATNWRWRWWLGWVFYLALVNILTILSLWSFFLVALSNPGEVPVNFKSELAINFPERQNHLRWCKKCDTIKPPRTHHCSHGCNTCILKMDHHCPWIANCVGFRNHGNFLRYISYTWLGAVTIELGLLVRLIQMIWWPKSATTTTYPGEFKHFVPILPISLQSALILLFNSIFLAAIILLLGILVFTTWRNVLSNCTTIERLEIREGERMAATANASVAKRTNSKLVTFPYFVSSLKSIELVLGRRKWAWPFPLAPTWQMDGLGDGLHFETCQGMADYDWPPFDYSYSSDDDDDDYYEQQEGKASLANGTRREKVVPSRVMTIGNSDPDLLMMRARSRRDSEGYLLPETLPWHQFNSDPQLYKNSR